MQLTTCVSKLRNLALSHEAWLKSKIKITRLTMTKKRRDDRQFYPYLSPSDRVQLQVRQGELRTAALIIGLPEDRLQSWAPLLMTQHP